MNHTLIRAEYDMNGIVVYANMNFLEILGYENNSDIEGQHFSKFIDNKDLPRYEAMWTELIHGGKHHKVDMRHLTKEGKDVWVMSTYACLRDENGDPVKISFIGIDITERRKQDLAYESQINALNNALLKAELSSDGEFVSKNKLFESLFEYDEEQYKSLTIFDFLAAENKDSFIIDWREILEGRPYKSRQKLVTGSGEYKWFQVNYSSTFNLYGELDKVILLATDITEQKRIEEDAHKKAEELKKQEKELRHNIEEMKSIQEKMTANQEKLTLSEKQLKEQVAIVEQEKYKTAQILEGCVEGIISFREDGTVEMYNKAAEDILGFPRSEIIDKNITDFIGLSIVETTNDVEIIYNGPEKIKLNNAKNEIMVKNASGEEVSVLITLNEVITGEEYNFTAFVQNIEVELF
ncbi:MAG: hypothetical protein C0594_01000 [Marinilabiliales bacterium]|nr:MAG: hypothetical protein C0594_01000 [Marinilabiliales bacterium]